MIVGCLAAYLAITAVRLAYRTALRGRSWVEIYIGTPVPSLKKELGRIGEMGAFLSNFFCVLSFSWPSMNFATKGISTNLSYTARTRSPNLEGTTLKSCVHGVLVTPGMVQWLGKPSKREKRYGYFSLVKYLVCGL